jgi:hypothetical protein
VTEKEERAVIHLETRAVQNLWHVVELLELGRTCSMTVCRDEEDFAFKEQA